VGDICEFDKPEVVRVIWDCFAELARRPEASDVNSYFHLFLDNERHESVIKMSFEKCREANLTANMSHFRYPPFRHAVQKVFEVVKSMGLILPGKADQKPDWGQEFGVFHFTSEGLRYFQGGYVCVDDPGHLAEVLRDLQSHHSQISDGQIELLLEAQKCMRAGCYRAAMVLIGVANEDICIGLLDTLASYPKPPTKKAALWNYWAEAKNTNNHFTKRWKPGLRILEKLKEDLRAMGRGKEWWKWWEVVPRPLAALGEAVRIARNAAAHEAERRFTKPEVGLLLAALPMALEAVCEIQVFLATPPEDVKLPRL